jgi:hypothetical protein
MNKVNFIGAVKGKNGIHLNTKMSEVLEKAKVHLRAWDVMPEEFTPEEVAAEALRYYGIAAAVSDAFLYIEGGNDETMGYAHASKAKIELWLEREHKVDSVWPDQREAHPAVDALIAKLKANPSLDITLGEVLN